MKIPSHSGGCVLGEGQLYTLYPMAKGLRDIQYEHGTRHEISCLTHYGNLLQTATNVITKCDKNFITKCNIILL